MRVRELLENQEQIEYFSLSPSDIETPTLQKIKQLITSGGEVSNIALDTNLSNAKNITFAQINEEVIAVVVLKNPNPSYTSKVFSLAGVSDKQNFYPYEVGYVYAIPEYRRSRVIFTLFHMFNDKLNGTFATVRSDNAPAIKLLNRCGYRNIGIPYKSSRGAYNLLLYVSND